MIFSRFFPPAHASSNPKTRIEAIAKLSVDSPNERRILHELAFNDENANVSIAALEQLNSFPLWLKMAQTAADNKVKNVAKRWIESAIVHEHNTLHKDERDEFLLKSASIDLTTQVLSESEDISQDTQLVLALLTKIDRPAFTQKYFLTMASPEVKSHIIEATDNTDLLQKLMRKSDDEEIKAQLQGRIDDLIAQQQKPIELEKKVTLTLSKLQALMDKDDFVLIKEQQGLLNAEFQQFQQEFSCLNDDAIQSVNERYQRIEEKLARHLARLAPVWEAKQEAKALAAAKVTAQESVDKILAHQSILADERILNLTIGDIAQVQQTINQAEEAVLAFIALGGDGRSLQKQLHQWQNVWDGLPVIQRHSEQLTQILTELKDAIGKIDTAETLIEWRDWQQKWHKVTEQMSLVPAYLQGQWKQLRKEWQNSYQRHKAAQQADLKQIRKHLNIINNLVEQGKFRAAMARFGKLESDFTAIPKASQALLQRRFDQTKEQISQLEGWQSYLAAPRKPELLKEAQQLAESDAEDDISGRMRHIKYLRQQWLSLGKLGTPEDDALGVAFDETLELAFTPCRAYFAAQEARNEAAKTERLAIISALSAISCEQPMQELSREYEAVRQRWMKAPAVDSETYTSLKKQWDAAQKSIQQLLAQWYNQNKEEKLKLIQHIEDVFAEGISDDIAKVAIDAQQQWKTLGTAGKRHESRLWKQFRDVNDKIFNALKEQRNDQRRADKNQGEQVKLAIASFAEQLASLSRADINTGIRELQDKIHDLKGANKAALTTQLNKIVKLSEQQQRERQQDKKNQAVDTLVTFLSQWQGELADIDTGLEGCPKAWSQALKLNKADTEEKRKELTLQLEIVLAIESPKTEQQARSKLQLQMMTAKLAEGEEVSTQELINLWLSYGPVTDKLLLARFENVLKQKK
jgi:hypothetical protein